MLPTEIVAASERCLTPSERLTKARRHCRLAVIATIIAFLFIGAIAMGWRP